MLVIAGRVKIMAVERTEDTHGLLDPIHLVVDMSGGGRFRLSFGGYQELRAGLKECLDQLDHLGAWKEQDEEKGAGI